ncbi:MAG: hypothetical protein ACREXR_05145 [Gammaproteobacteria bacterium]
MTGWVERSETHQWVAAHMMGFGYRLFPSYGKVQRRWWKGIATMIDRLTN